MDTIAVAGAMILECSVRMTQHERCNFQDLIITQGNWQETEIDPRFCKISKKFF